MSDNVRVISEGDQKALTRQRIAHSLSLPAAVTVDKITRRVIDGYNQQLADIDHIPGHIALKVDPNSNAYQLSFVADRLASSILSTRGFLTVVQATKILINMANRNPQESEEMAVELLAWMGIKYDVVGVRGKAFARTRSVLREVPVAFSKLSKTPRERWKDEIWSRVSTGGYGPLMDAFKDTPAEQTIQVVALSMLQYMNIRALAAEVIREGMDVREVTDEAIQRVLDKIEEMSGAKQRLTSLEGRLAARMNVIEAAKLIVTDPNTDEGTEDAVLKDLEKQLEGLAEDRDEFAEVKKIVTEAPQLIEQGRLAVISGVNLDMALQDHVSELLNAAQQFKTLALLHLYQLALVYSSIVREMTRALMERNRKAQMEIIEDCK